MIYWWTGKPGAGKTLHAIDQLLTFKDKGRAVYACNVREFDYDKTGVERMEPADFRNWMEFLPDGAVALVDECYQHGMLPKMPNNTPVPKHIEELATHRHRGIDFIFVCQSPDKQCHTFVHDLIDWHTHVRRLFGTNVVQLRQFDRFEAHAEKATPILIKRGPLLGKKKSVGTYKSTEMDTTERRVPWYVYAFIVGVPLGLGYTYWLFTSMGDRLRGEPAPVTDAVQPMTATGDGANATTPVAVTTPATSEEYAAMFTPRVASQPWSAPIYDQKLSVSSEPPRLFCMLSDPGVEADGLYGPNSRCTCLSEQGTRYLLDLMVCAYVARHGQYEPYYDERSNQMRVDAESQQQIILADQRASRATEVVGGAVGSAPRPFVSQEFGTMTRPAL